MCSSILNKWTLLIINLLKNISIRKNILIACGFNINTNNFSEWWPYYIKFQLERWNLQWNCIYLQCEPQSKEPCQMSVFSFDCVSHWKSMQFHCRFHLSRKFFIETATIRYKQKLPLCFWCLNLHACSYMHVYSCIPILANDPDFGKWFRLDPDFKR